MPGPRRRALRTGVRVVLDDAPSRSGRDPSQLEILLELAVIADESGLDGFFLASSEGIDPYVVLGAAAARTTSIVLGCLAAPANERPPSVLAKVVTTLDVQSEGRAILGLAPSWPRHLEAPGQPNRPGELARPELELGDALEICRAMVRVPAPSYRGATAAIASAWNEPRYVESGPTPMALLAPEAPDPRTGGGPAQVGGLFALAARFTEVCAFEVGLSDPAEQLAEELGDVTANTAEGLRREFDAACLQAGRPPGEVGLVAVTALRASSSAATGDRDIAEVVRRATAWRRAGCDGVVVDVGPDDLGDKRIGDLAVAIAQLRD